MKQGKKVTKFQFLDSVRGFLAFTVAVGHYSVLTGCGVWSIVDWFHTLIGVVGFFILSSFLLTYRLLHEYTFILSKTDNTTSGKIKLLISNLIKFAIRRITRIHPLYITVALAVKYGPWFTKNAFLGLPNNFWHILFVTDSGTHITWTIRVEMTYYLFIPLICLLTSLCRKRFRAAPIILLTASCIYCDSSWTFEKCGGAGFCLYLVFKGWLSAFLAGSLLAILYYWVENYAESVSNTDILHRIQPENVSCNIFEKVLSSRIINLLNISCYFLSIIFILLLNRKWALVSLVNINYDIQKLILLNYPAYHWCLVLFLALLSRGSFANLFNNRFWNHAGKTSYSIYLIHWICLVNLKKVMNPELFRGFEGFTIFVFVIMVGSTITYHLIEYPGLWIGTKLCRIVDHFFDTWI